MITGESRSVAKQAGDHVVAGTVAAGGSLRVRVAAVGEDTALSGIMRLVAEAQASSRTRRCWRTGPQRSSSSWRSERA